MIDYETDSLDEAGASPAVAPTPTITDELREAHRQRQEAEAPYAANRLRERARVDLENLTWIDSAGREIPASWTVFAESYYEVLCGAAGLNGDDDTRDSDSRTARLYVWLWLATHNLDDCFRRDPETGLALKDNKTRWLAVIFEWAAKEFPMGAGHFERQEEALQIRDVLVRLSYSGRAEVMESLEPSDEEDAPGNSPAPLG
jgi:hypothetical protein